jgi:hypothetical protein
MRSPRLLCLQRRALHGEQSLELKGPLPPHGRLVSRPQLVDVRDKGPGKGIVTLVRTVTHDADTGIEIAVAEFTGVMVQWGCYPQLCSVPGST